MGDALDRERLRKTLERRLDVLIEKAEAKTMTTDKGTLRPWSLEYVQHGNGEGNEFHAATIVDAEGKDILQSVTFYSDGSPISAPQFRHSRELIVHCVNNYDPLMELAERMAEAIESGDPMKITPAYNAFRQFQKEHQK